MVLAWTINLVNKTDIRHSFQLSLKKKEEIDTFIFNQVPKSMEPSVKVAFFF